MTFSATLARRCLLLGQGFDLSGTDLDDGKFGRNEEAVQKYQKKDGQQLE